ncbi:hypothetical protein RJ641_014133 [Dillenia turbinata]|uniref:Acyl carrier protein n=1 Tax=Dillenia turbinata TaxID=194707 RepID=A0AAN8UR64_9MAGN
MAAVSATSVGFQRSLNQSSRTNEAAEKYSRLRLVSRGWAKTKFPSLRTSHFHVYCAAKPETVQKVCQIVEIVMGLEEEFGISVEEESSQNITTVQEAADLIEKLVQKKPE